MRPFEYQTSNNPAAASRLVASKAKDSDTSHAAFLAGGTTLLDLMKLDVMRPDLVVNINSFSKEWNAIRLDGNVLSIGATARMSDVADNADVKKYFPVVADSLNLAASAQLRNMATVGGNVLQRTRCTYFRDISYSSCNKRHPGSGCAALDGVNRLHAVLGTSENCIATYPGDFAQALIALDATVDLVSSSGSRTLPFSELHKTPGSSPDIETVLHPGELIARFKIPARWPRSLYLKVRDRESYEFALASAAVALDMQDSVVRDVRIALGGVATAPWRAPQSETVLRGQTISDDLMRHAADAAFEQAQPREENRYKIALGKQTIIRALKQAAALEI